MIHSMLARALHLEAWATRLEARADFPALVRRLVNATAASARRIDFPAQERTGDRGWDGQVEAEAESTFVPAGSSRWELGTGQDPKRKATDEYRKRSEDPLDCDQAQTTFIFASPRPWKGRKAWVRERNAEQVWREVRAYDSSDIEQWLESAPGVHVWASRLLGMRPAGVLDLESWWTAWSEVTQPPTSAALVKSGRYGTVAEIHAWLAGNSAHLVLAADSREEALAVFSAALQDLEDAERERRLASIVVVEERSAWEEHTAIEQPLILVPMLHPAPPPRSLSASGQRHLLALDHSSVSRKNHGHVIRVPRLSRTDATAVLECEGHEARRAHYLAGTARRSLSAYRREIAATADRTRPAWTESEPARGLLPALLLGAWDGALAADRGTVEALAGRSYNEWSATIAGWIDSADPPLRRVDQSWYLASKLDAWDLPIDRIENRDLECFEAQAVEVLAEPDPRFDLPVHERWMAGGLGVVPSHSQLLRSSLADTLAFLGAHGEGNFPHAQGTGRLLAARIVCSLLDRADSDAKVWASLGGLLPLIAEAAPDEFLEHVEKGVAGAEPVLAALFEESGTGMFVDAPHLGLMWALETLAWSTDHLARASLALARLAELDRGGGASSRPLESLRKVFLIRLPSTGAALAPRLKALDRIRERHSVVAWSLLLNLVPQADELVLLSDRPRWRDWVQEVAGPVPAAEGDSALDAVASRLLDDTGVSGERWSELIAILPRFPAASFEAAIQKLSTIPASAEGRLLVWDALRKLISKHRSSPNSWWALPEAQVDAMVSLLPAFTPEDPITTIASVFDREPSLLEGLRGELDEDDAALEEARLKALATVMAENGLDRMHQLVTRVEDPSALGLTAGRSELLDELEDELLGSLTSSDGDAPRQFIAAFAWARTQRHGVGWVKDKLEDVARSWTPGQRAELILALSPRPETWELATGAGCEVAHEYWRRVNPVRVLDDDRERATKELIARARPLAAMRLWTFRSHAGAKPTVALVLRMLELAQEGSDEHESWRDVLPDSLPALLQVLDETPSVDEQRVASLEWNWFPFIIRSPRGPRALHAELARDPGFFVQLVEIMDRAEGEAPRQLDEHARTRRTRAIELLRRWRQVPGMDGDDIDGPALLDWVRRARAALAASDRTKIGDRRIGELLSAGPQGPDGFWPHPAVRQVIEDAGSPELERGLFFGRSNAPVLQRRDPYGGGAPERDRAERDRAATEGIADDFPRTAAMLGRFANWGVGSAQREDQQSELYEDLT